MPTANEVQSWIEAVLADQNPTIDPHSELTVRVVDEAEGALLNEKYRGYAGATNVLSFPFEPLEGVPVRLLGDIVICAPVVKREARQQGKETRAHWAHMVVHGTLHLLGYDHKNQKETKEMEQLETKILERLGFEDPYTSL